MTAKLVIAFAFGLQIAAGGIALAQDQQPIELSKQQLKNQDEETRVLNLLENAGYTSTGPLQKVWVTNAAKAGGAAERVVVDPAAGTVMPVK